MVKTYDIPTKILNKMQEHKKKKGIPLKYILIVALEDYFTEQAYNEFYELGDEEEAQMSFNIPDNLVKNMQDLNKVTGIFYKHMVAVALENYLKKNTEVTI